LTSWPADAATCSTLDGGTLTIEDTRVVVAVDSDDKSDSGW
jgi:hypothetical protein